MTSIRAKRLRESRFTKTTVFMVFISLVLFCGGVILLVPILEALFPASDAADEPKEGSHGLEE